MIIDRNVPFKMCVCGFNGSGKTTFVKNLIEKLGLSTLIYDWHSEYGRVKGRNVFNYSPIKRYPFEERVKEMEEIIQKVFLKPRKIKLLVVDEANEYCPNGKELPSTIQDLYDNHRHYKQSMITIARRPVDLCTKLMEVAHYRIFFKLTGKNDLQYLDSLKSGLADVVSALQKYEYAMLDADCNISIGKPVKT